MFDFYFKFWDLHFQFVDFYFEFLICEREGGGRISVRRAGANARGADAFRYGGQVRTRPRSPRIVPGAPELSPEPSPGSKGQGWVQGGRHGQNSFSRGGRPEKTFDR